MPDGSCEELAIRLREHRGDYGFDAPLQGLVPTGTRGLLLALPAATYGRSSRRGLAAVEAVTQCPPSGVVLGLSATTRRGKFAVWADVLAGLDLRGDEHVLDMGCGRWNRGEN